MTTGQVYVLDTNVFIEAARRYYAFDLVPPFWTSLVSLAGAGSVVSIDRVQTELRKGKDALATWAMNDFAHGFVSSGSADVVTEYSKIMNWVNGQRQFKQTARAEFAGGADGWLVAYAAVNGCVLVTHEELRPDAQNRVPIPNVCEAFNVEKKDAFEMLRALGVKFI